MARNLTVLLALLFLTSLSARAQERIDAFGGYSYQRFGSSSGRNLNGAEISGQYKFMNWLGGVADLDSHFGSGSLPNSRTLHFLVGPQVTFPARVSPFAHVLVGAGHFHSGGFSDTSFATAVGGGIDWRVAPLFSWRVFQADDVVTKFFGGTQNSARISTGLVFRF